ncbi:MAG: hypothetical protein NDI61_04785 [Bdellovibrionaceae bacterium]|nr:hypothetical protein [Pseudobdellovibrionaceae bacterium]
MKSSYLTKMRSILALGAVFFLFVFAFQNCAPPRVLFQAIGVRSMDNGNGGGYTGKPGGTYVRFVPDFSCEEQSAPKAVITVQAPGDITYVENNQFKCGAVSGPLDPDLITTSRMQNEAISYRAVPFERFDRTPAITPDNLLEAWCRDLTPGALFEVISHYDRVQQQAVARTYVGTEANGLIQVTTSPDQAAARLVGPTQVFLRGETFELVIDRTRFTAAPGEFTGDFKSTRDGSTRVLSCALGGALDPQVWPAKVVYDLPILNPDESFQSVPIYSISPDRNSILVRTSLTPRASPIDFLAEPYFPALLRKNAQNEFRVSVNQSLPIHDAEFTPDSRGLVVVGRPAPYVAEQLLRVDLSGENLLLLNQLGTSNADNVTPKFAIDPQSGFVFYFDTIREWGSVGVTRDTLWRASLQGGPPVRLHELSTAGMSYVNNLHIVPSVQKVAFELFEPAGGQISRRYFATNFDGTGTQEFQPNVPAGMSDRGLSAMRSLDPFFQLSVGLFSTESILPMGQNASLFDLRDGRRFDFPMNANHVSLVSADGQWALVSYIANFVAYQQGAVSGIWVQPEWVTRLHHLSSGQVYELGGNPLLQGFSADSRYLWFTRKVDATTLAASSSQVMRLSLNSLTEEEVCAQPGGRWLSFQRRATGTPTELPTENFFGSEFLGLHLTGDLQSLGIYKITDVGDCHLLNRVPLQSGMKSTEHGTIHFNQRAPDGSSILISLPGTPQRLIHVPLNGTPPTQVNSPRHAQAKILKADYFGDGKEIVYQSDQEWPNIPAIYRWSAP